MQPLRHWTLSSDTHAPHIERYLRASRAAAVRRTYHFGELSNALSQCFGDFIQKDQQYDFLADAWRLQRFETISGVCESE